jgi:transposase
VDKSPASARLSAVATAGDLPTAPTPRPGTRPRRWVVERFFAWIGRNRRFARDVERLVASVEAFIYAAASVILLRRLARC